MRYIFGRNFNSIYKTLYNNDNNNLIISILKYISNNNIVVEEKYNLNLKKGVVEYDYFLENCKHFIEKALITNNISIDQIYEKSIIKPLIEFNKFRGLFIYKCINIIKDLFQVYKYLTGNYPVCQNFLICNNETSIHEIISFLYRAILCNYHSCYIIGGIHNLNAENKNYY